MAEEPRPGSKRRRRRHSGDRRPSSPPSEATTLESSEDAAATDPLDFPHVVDRVEEPVQGDLAEDANLGLGDYEDDDEFDAASGDFSQAPDEDEDAPLIRLSPNLPPIEPQDLDPTSLPWEQAPLESGGANFEEIPGVRNVVGVKFSPAGKIYLYDGGDHVYNRGEEVVVESDRGPRLGTVALASVRRPRSRASLRRVLRKPEPGDQQNIVQNHDREQHALQVARRHARALHLPIKVFRAEYNLAGSRVTLYFSAEGKVDTRGLLQALQTELSGRLDLRQTGVRDEAKMIGGIGSCGQTLCCTTWLPAFAPVSIRNAKDQGLVLNPTKVSGQCGRLKCCLVYEQQQYAELRTGLPRLGKRVTTSAGEGRVIEVDVLHQRIRVSFPGGDQRMFPAREVQLAPAHVHHVQAEPNEDTGQ